MKASRFHTEWWVKDGVAQPFDAIFLGGIPKGEPVMLPQDAMILETRDEHCESKNQAGYYPAKTYTYTKEFHAPAEWENQTVLVEFEGVMAQAMVYLNNQLLACHKYGYSGFYVDLREALLYDRKNTLKVVAVNQELASRWYPGSGIYRDVVLWEGGRQTFVPDGVRLTTLAARDNAAEISVAYEMKNAQADEAAVTVTLELLDGQQVIHTQEQAHVLKDDSVGEVHCSLTNVQLWSPEHPFLYTLRLTMRDASGKVCDEHTEAVGLRKLSLSAETGLCINGETVKLRGACIHHDNGIIGATTLYAAEEYRLTKLKEAGFNSIRSAHHPASKAMLRACDKLGMLVMDELTDMWCEQKNAHDFALDFPLVWQDEVARMVRKDYNHPCVVLYSTGNEIPEIGCTSGHRMNKKLVDAIHQLDSTRYVTNGISGFLAVSYHMEKQGKMEDRREAYEKAQAEAANEAQGSEKMNAIAGDVERKMMDVFSCSPLLNESILPVEEACDVVGYNYLTARHEYIHGEHPEWIVVGSETYPTEIAELWSIVEKNSHVIGDFTWTGYDYLGEAGIGIFHYDPTMLESGYQGWFPDRLAYCGDINLNGYRRPVSYLREIAYGLRTKPYLFARRVDKAGQRHDKNRWKYHDGVHSWTYPGYEGTETMVYVLTKDPEAELFLNGVSLGKKKVGEVEVLTAIFEVPYQPGTLTVRTASGEDSIVTAGEVAGLRVEASRTVLEKGGQDVIFITADLVDSEGRANHFAVRKIEAVLEGEAVLAGFGSADPSCEGSYTDTVWETFDGRVMAAVRSGMKAGKAELKLIMDGKVAAIIPIEVK